MAKNNVDPKLVSATEFLSSNGLVVASDAAPQTVMDIAKRLGWTYTDPDVAKWRELMDEIKSMDDKTAKSLADKYGMSVAELYRLAAGDVSAAETAVKRMFPHKFPPPPDTSEIDAKIRELQGKLNPLLTRRGKLLSEYAATERNTLREFGIKPTRGRKSSGTADYPLLSIGQSHTVRHTIKNKVVTETLTYNAPNDIVVTAVVSDTNGNEIKRVVISARSLTGAYDTLYNVSKNPQCKLREFGRTNESGVRWFKCRLAPDR